MVRRNKLLSLILVCCLSVQGAGMIAHAETEPLTELERNFTEPAQEMKTFPLWFWNDSLDEMTEDQVREIVRKSYEESGYNGFAILSNWLDGYLTDEYMNLYEAALDEGRKYGMTFSLYDENGFPSYNAGGLFEEYAPDLTAKRLDKYEADASAGENVYLKLPEGTFMGAVAMNTDTKQRIDISEYATIVSYIDPEKEPLGASASSVYSLAPGFEADKAFDEDPATRWNAEGQSGDGQYLQVNFGEIKEFDNIQLFEDQDENLHRTQKYTIKYWDGEKKEWVTLVTGDTITDSGAVHTLDQAVKAQVVRIIIDKVSTDSATINEIQFFNDGDQVLVPAGCEEAGYSASTTYENESGYEADKAFDGKDDTRWNSGSSVDFPQWIEISLGTMQTIDKVVLKESSDTELQRINSFDLQYWDGETWETCASGTEIGSNAELEFSPVSTSKMRLHVNSIKDEAIQKDQKSITLSEMELYSGEEKIQITDGYAGSYLDYTVPDEGNWKVMAFMCVKDGNNGMDYLDEKAVRAYLDVVYERYYEEFEEYFGTTITSAFFDEPTFLDWPWTGGTAYGVEGSRTWTPGFNEAYEKIYNESPVLNYPALWYDIGEDTVEARDRMQYVRTDLFATNYIGQIAGWCDEKGIDVSGHMLLEEYVNPVGLHGDLMKVFKYQQIPGVDVIGNHGNAQESYKIISSSAYNWDKRLVMSEAFGAINNATPDTLLKITMDLYAKGINQVIPHAVWYDTTDVDFLPELSYRDQTFSEFLPEFNNYAARLNTLLQGGRHVADIAMLYPIDYLESSYTMDMGEADVSNPANPFPELQNGPEGADYMRVGETLSLKIRKDFTYLHPEVIDEKCSVNGETIHLDNEVNYEDYKVFIIPGTKVISLSNLEKIKEFYDNGGKVISTTQLPYMATNAEDNEKVAAIIKDMFNVDPVTGSASGTSGEEYTKNSNDKGGAAYFIQSGFDSKLEGVLDDALSVYDVEISNVPALSNGNLSYIHKVNNNADIYFVANSSDTDAGEIQVSIRGELKNPEIWNPVTGAIEKADFNTKNGITTINLDLDKVQSLFIVDAFQTNSITGISDISKVYNGKPVDAPTFDQNGTEKAVVEYKAKSDADEAYSTEAPVKAGEYTVRITVPSHENYAEASAETDFTITPKELTVNVKVADKQYDGTDKATIESAVLEGVVEGDDVTLVNGEAAFASSQAGESIAVNFTEFSLEGEDAGNYTLKQPTGVTADIVAKDEKPGTGPDTGTGSGAGTDQEADVETGHGSQSTNKTPETGDTDNPVPWVILIMACGGIVTVFRKRIYSKK